MKLNAKLLKRENAQATIQVIVDKEEVKNQFDKVSKDYQEKVILPGFRKGKAPLNIIKNKYKTDIFNEVLNDLINHSYYEALHIINLNPYGQPEIKLKKFSEDESLEFEAEVQTRPEIELDKYKDLSFTIDEYKFEKEDVDKELLKLQERSADLIVKENNKVEENDVVFLEIKAYDKDNNNIKEMNNDNFKLEVSKDKIDKEFYDTLLGAMNGDEKEIKKHYADDFQNKTLAGKDIIFKVKIKEVREKKLPLLDDEFAKDIGYDNFEGLKKAIENQLTNIIEKHKEDQLQQQMIKKIIESAKFQIPEKLINDRTNVLMREFQYRLHRQGQDIKDLISQKVIDIENIRKDIREQAIEEIKTSLILIKVAEKENVKVEETEFENFIKEEALKSKIELDEYKKKLNPETNDYIRQLLLTRKVIEFLKTNNKIKKGKTYPFTELLKTKEQTI